MTQDNIVRIYISAMEQISPDSSGSESKVEWEAVYEFADKMIWEIQPLFNAYQTDKND